MSAADLLDAMADPDPVDLSIGAPPPPSIVTPDGADPAADVWTDEPTPEVPEAVVRGILASAGTLLGMSPLADPDVPAHWSFTEAELDALTPPMTRIVNARPALRRAAAHGDEVTVAVQLAGYGGRNLLLGAAAKRARTNQPEEWEYEDHGNVEPEAGSAAPGGGGPGARSDVIESAVGPGGVGYGIHPPAD